MSYHQKHYDSKRKAQLVQGFIDGYESDRTKMQEYMRERGLPDEFRHWVAADGRWKPQPWISRGGRRRSV